MKTQCVTIERAKSKQRKHDHPTDPGHPKSSLLVVFEPSKTLLPTFVCEQNSLTLT